MKRLNPLTLVALAVALALAGQAGAQSYRHYAPTVPRVGHYSPCQPYPHRLDAVYCGPWRVPADPANPFANSSLGQCTYWALEKRPDLWANRNPADSQPSWDAWTFPEHARSEGLHVDNTPQVGALVVWSAAQEGAATGHVAYVQEITAGRSIVITETNRFFPLRGDTLLILHGGESGWRNWFEHGPLRFIHTVA